MKPAVPATLLATCMAGAAFGQSVALQGMLGNKALLIINGGTPRTVAPGETFLGVKVLSTLGEQAVIEIEGKRHTLRVGEAPASVGAGGPGSRGNKVVLAAGTGGHFITPGRINGRPVQFLVDTGATDVGMSVAEAERVGLDYNSGRPIRMSTANGVVQGWQVRLASIRIGDVEVFDIAGSVSPAPMPYVLLGNSFLTRFQMKRDNDQLVLERRY